mmetsp:Transcript_21532/g.46059  ORF Transcript_21532/g.46059 Transcript_21532/m.46059 type:complete len:348 (-) Transcript_21532:222-1265(-)
MQRLRDVLLLVQRRLRPLSILRHVIAEYEIEEVVHGLLGTFDPIVQRGGEQIEVVLLPRMGQVSPLHLPLNAFEHDEVVGHQGEVHKLVGRRHPQPLFRIQGAQVVEIRPVGQARPGAPQRTAVPHDVVEILARHYGDHLPHASVLQFLGDEIGLDVVVPVSDFGVEGLARVNFWVVHERLRRRVQRVVAVVRRRHLEGVADQVNHLDAVLGPRVGWRVAHEHPPEFVRAAVKLGRVHDGHRPRPQRQFRALRLPVEVLAREDGVAPYQLVAEVKREVLLQVFREVVGEDVPRLVVGHEDVGVLVKVGVGVFDVGVLVEVGVEGGELARSNIFVGCIECDQIIICQW